MPSLVVAGLDVGIDEKSRQEQNMEGFTMAAKTRSQSSRPASFLRVAYSAPPKGESIAAELRRFTLPATKALPFVKLRAKDQPLQRPENFWRVRPTGKRDRDVQIGRQYARQAIAAMKADRNSSLIALIVQDIIKDALERTTKKGLSAQSPIVMGFLSEISAALAAAP
jgi:hypothetical protein